MWTAHYKTACERQSVSVLPVPPFGVLEASALESGIAPCLALDLGRATGFAAGDLADDIPTAFGHFTIKGDAWGEMAVDLERQLLALFYKYPPGIIVYESVIVLHPRAGQTLAGYAFITEYLAVKANAACFSIPNAACKKNFCGFNYGKKTIPYPGLTEAKRRGFPAKTTDEADALAVWFAAQARWLAGGIVVADSL